MTCPTLHNNRGAQASAQHSSHILSDQDGQDHLTESNPSRLQNEVRICQVSPNASSPKLLRRTLAFEGDTHFRASFEGSCDARAKRGACAITTCPPSCATIDGMTCRLVTHTSGGYRSCRAYSQSCIKLTSSLWPSH